ncbi:DEAD/DEAH box helicase [Planctomyces sp. SH-PL62]|uniref:DEAD/DEAH box helicase n=1 Tax=Planctomyces sp. SH-PL62 TaxID=1636152 RepID=UPI00078D3D78|nr:DEAD/DEAH box helicase [Planctomyces sp. SH-PL62]AMV39459.1 putative ATP-dependent helicase Lhr [Planctomyces sp. SH-PL62]
MSSGRKKRGGRGATEAPGDSDVLDLFLPPVANWFRSTLGEPTLPQRLGWRSIAAGRNTLIAAPTGSGKSLAAFLAGLDLLWRSPERGRGVRILYVSPLKALNADVHRNLRTPLEGILEEAEASGTPLRPLSTAVRSGDTPASERARILRKPPEILIITPESLHLMLTSRARDTLREVSHVVVDEIHALCGDKRGVFLSLLLERLEALGAGRPFTRIGLSATQKPLEEVARYLGGVRPDGAQGGEFRPVEIVDAGGRKPMDLQVIWPSGEDGGKLGPPGSIWPAIEDRVLGLVEEHRSTLVFANNRRTVEKLTARLNELATRDVEREAPGESDEPVATPFRAHHGSLSLDERRTTEEMLKRADLKAVVSTASLELGIDMGEVDLVCQVESPGNVARGLQRVGRSGHLVGGISRGRLIAKTPSDLLETAALARAMLAGDIEPLRVPRNCLDVLAQQVVACVAMDRWDASELYDLVRRAYSFSELSADAFERVLRLVSGRYSTGSIRDLRARVAWDRVHNQLGALPGTSRLALTGGGTIPDVGHFPVYLGEGGPKLGELDEEFVFERRVGESFMLGNSAWRIEVIDVHKVIVGPAEGSQVVMPFWRGETNPRSMELGQAVGVLTREIAEGLDDPGLPARLERECRLEPAAARLLIRRVARQRRLAGVVPDDRTILVESFRDPTGETALAVLSPYGRMHLGLKLALLARIQDRYGFTASCLHGDDGLLFRLPQTEEPPLDLLDGLDGAEAERLIRRVLPDTSLFGLRFRQNAGRALLMPRPDPSKRTPLWLQRLRAKDLLGVVGEFPDHPIVVETYRECLDDDLQTPRLREFLDAVSAGTIRVEKRADELASPFASDLVFQFTAAYIYEWDEPRRKPDESRSATIDVDLLDGLLHGLEAGRGLDEQAVGRVEGRLRQRGRPPRTADEMAETLRTLGDLAASDLAGPMEAFAVDLAGQGRAARIELEGTSEPGRWISAEESALYASAFAPEAAPDAEAVETIVRRYLKTHALVGLADLIRRYPIPPETARTLLEAWVESSDVVQIEEGDDGPRWAERENLAEIQRLTLAQRRKESVAVAPEVFADFFARRQHVHPETRLSGIEGVEAVLEQFQGFAATAEFWEEELLPRRVVGYQRSWLDEALARGAWTWRAATDGRETPLVAIVPRGFAGGWPEPTDAPPLSDDEPKVLEALERRGASFAADLARASGVDLLSLRRTLRSLLHRGAVANDRFDPLRPGAFEVLDVVDRTSAGASRGGRRRGISRRVEPSRPEGRWELVVPAVESDERTLAWIDALFARYGVLARETAAVDAWAPPWSTLYPHLARLELRGEIRRGYFVEGLSGVQYATEEAAEGLAALAAATGRDALEILISAADPANLYGAGAPLDIPLLEGGAARLIRSTGNFLVLRGGRPILILEAYGKRLTGLASASKAELDAALARVLDMASPERRVFKVETYNGQPTVASAAAERLTELGFVRDYPALTYYAAWSPGGI